MRERNIAMLVFGTRPEVVKIAGIASSLGRRALLVSTGQHVDNVMFEGIARDVGLRRSDISLQAGGETRGRQLGLMTLGLESVVANQRPACIVVQGDTTSALAGALVANANDLPLVHVEAGLRSFDRRMPEEHNRVLIDHLADLCCAPTVENRRNLASERISLDRIAVTGNTVVEAVLKVLSDEHLLRATRLRFSVVDGQFVLATFHRPENVDDSKTFGQILSALAECPIPVILPLHPRSHSRIREYGLGALLQKIRSTGPLGYREMIALARLSAGLITDSGGLQEEASVVKRPVLVVRRSSERQEIEGLFGRRVNPADALMEEILNFVKDATPHANARLENIRSPYGSGDASRQIAELISSRYLDQ